MYVKAKIEYVEKIKNFEVGQLHPAHMAYIQNQAKKGKKCDFGTFLWSAGEKWSCPTSNFFWFFITFNVSF